MTPDATNHEILAELAQLARMQAPELSQFGSLAAAHQYLRLYATWRRCVPRGAKVLDWGSGNGHFSYFLQRAKYPTTAFSFDPPGFERFLPEGEFRYVSGDEKDPVRLPFPGDAFEAVASIGVLEHVRETGGSEQGSLAEIARVLRPGGVFVCWHFPNRWSWIDWMSRGVPGKHSHLYRYEPSDLRRLVSGAGLEMVEAGRYGVLPRNSLHRVLGPTRDARWMADLWDGLDAVLGVPFGAIAQNHYFVARRPR